jgi:hypothetical protein
MEPHILFVLLLAGPVEPVPLRGREVTWSAEFTSPERCNEAGLALAKKYNTPPGERFVVIVDYVCLKK